MKKRELFFILIIFLIVGGCSSKIGSDNKKAKMEIPDPPLAPGVILIDGEILKQENKKLLILVVDVLNAGRGVPPLNRGDKLSLIYEHKKKLAVGSKYKLKMHISSEMFGEEKRFWSLISID